MPHEVNFLDLKFGVIGQCDGELFAGRVNGGIGGSIANGQCATALEGGDGASLMIFTPTRHPRLIDGGVLLEEVAITHHQMRGHAWCNAAYYGVNAKQCRWIGCDSGECFVVRQPSLDCLTHGSVDVTG